MQKDIVSYFLVVCEMSLCLHFSLLSLEFLSCIDISPEKTKFDSQK